MRWGWKIANGNDVDSLLFVCVAPIVGLLPLLNSISGEPRVKYVRVGRANDFYGRPNTVSYRSTVKAGEDQQKRDSLLFMSVLAASGAGSSFARSSTVISVKPLRRRRYAVDMPKQPAPTMRTLSFLETTM